MSRGDTVYIALGHRCSSAAILDRCHLGSESLPFDSIVCQLNVVEDCLATGFKEFMDVGNYVKANTTTANHLDGVVEVWGHEMPSVNTYYEDASSLVDGEDLSNRSTYHLQLALTHHDLAQPQDYATYARRIDRLYGLLQEGKRKIGVYINPLLGLEDYRRQRDHLIDTFTNFSEFLAQRFVNMSVLFFILVKPGDAAGEELSRRLLKNDLCSVYVIYVNRGFIDAGGPFEGNCEREMKTLIDLIQQTDS
jgi:hypothetical protein